MIIPKLRFIAALNDPEEEVLRRIVAALRRFDRGERAIFLARLESQFPPEPDPRKSEIARAGWEFGLEVAERQRQGNDDNKPGA